MTTKMILRDKFTSRSKMAATDPQLRKVEIIDNREHLACLLFYLLISVQEDAL